MPSCRVWLLTGFAAADQTARAPPWQGHQLIQLLITFTRVNLLHSPIVLLETPTWFRKPHLVYPAPFKHLECGSSWPCLVSGEVNPPAWGKSRCALRSPARLWVSGNSEEAAHLHHAPRGFIYDRGIPSFTLPAPSHHEVWAGGRALSWQHAVLCWAACGAFLPALAPLSREELSWG